MPNWITPTSDALRDITAPAIIAKAEQLAAANGIDPMRRSIAAAVARVRRACSTGNALETDPATVPASLEDVTLRLARAALYEFLQFPLDDDQKTRQAEDVSDLKRICDERIRVEVPENPLADGQTIQRQPSPAIHIRPRRFTARAEDGI